MTSLHRQNTHGTRIQ